MSISHCRIATLLASVTLLGAGCSESSVTVTDPAPNEAAGQASTARDDAPAFKPIIHKGCGDRVLPPITLPEDAVLTWSNPDGELASVRGEAVDPESSAGLPNILSVAATPSSKRGEEFLKAGTYKGTEVSTYAREGCWTLRFAPYE